VTLRIIKSAQRRWIWKRRSPSALRVTGTRYLAEAGTQRKWFGNDEA
jgi:hypothetical protein